MTKDKRFADINQYNREADLLMGNAMARGAPFPIMIEDAMLKAEELGVNGETLHNFITGFSEYQHDHIAHITELDGQIEKIEFVRDGWDPSQTLPPPSLDVSEYSVTSGSADIMLHNHAYRDTGIMVGSTAELITEHQDIEEICFPSEPRIVVTHATYRTSVRKHATGDPPRLVVRYSMGYSDAIDTILDSNLVHAMANHLFSVEGEMNGAREARIEKAKDETRTRITSSLIANSISAQVRGLMMAVEIMTTLSDTTINISTHHVKR